MTARDLWLSKVEGIDAGADGYLAKPFHMAELVARVRALVRRTPVRANPVMTSGSIKFDTRTATVTQDGNIIELSAFELRVLQFLMHRTSQVITRSEMIKHIFAQDFDRDFNTIEIFVRRLRVKLGADAIETMRGQGYRMP